VSEEPEVVVAQQDRILVITINRPQARNAVNAAVSQGLANAMDRLDDDPALSVAVLIGAGGSFCAGMDLKAFARGENVVVRSSKIALNMHLSRAALGVLEYALAQEYTSFSTPEFKERVAAFRARFRK